MGRPPSDEDLIELPIDEGSRWWRDRAEPDPAPSGRARTALLGAAAVVLAIVAGNVVFGSSPSPVAEPTADDLPTTVDPTPLEVVAGVSATANRHGDTARVLVTGAMGDVTVSLCAPDDACVRLLRTAPVEGEVRALATIVQTFPSGGTGDTSTLIDCGTVDCALTISDGRDPIRIPVAFDADPPPAPTLRLMTDEPVQISDTVTVTGTGFTPTAQPAGIRLLLCPPGLHLTPPCVFVARVSTQDLTADGSFEQTVTMASPTFLNLSPVPAELCDPRCDLVARPPYGDEVRVSFAFDSGSP